MKRQIFKLDSFLIIYNIVLKNKYVHKPCSNDSWSFVGSTSHPNLLEYAWRFVHVTIHHGFRCYQQHALTYIQRHHSILLRISSFLFRLYSLYGVCILLFIIITNFLDSIQTIHMIKACMSSTSLTKWEQNFTTKLFGLAPLTCTTHSTTLFSLTEVPLLELCPQTHLNSRDTSVSKVSSHSSTISSTRTQRTLVSFLKNGSTCSSQLQLQPSHYLD